MAYSKSSVTDHGRGKNLTGFEYSHQHSSTPAEVPAASDLRLGELAVNSADAALYCKAADGTVKAISGGIGDAPVDGVSYGRKDEEWVDLTSPANLQVRRGTAAEVAAVTPMAGEPVWATDTRMLSMGDGSTAGGVKFSPTYSLSSDALLNASFNAFIPSSWAADLQLQASLATSGSSWYVDLLSSYGNTSPTSGSPAVRLALTGLNVRGTGMSFDSDGSIKAFDPAYGSNSATMTASSSPSARWTVRWSGIVTLTSASAVLGFEHQQGGSSVQRLKGFIRYQRIS